MATAPKLPDPPAGGPWNELYRGVDTNGDPYISSAIGTLVERRTRYLTLIHVATGRPTAEAMRNGIVAALGQLPVQLRRTLTWDQGKELAMHQQISEQTGT